MKTKFIMSRIFNLQMFEGGAASSAAASGGTQGASAEAGQTKATDQQPAVKVMYGKQPAQPAAEVTQEQAPAQNTQETDNTQPAQKSDADLSAEFEKLIKGDYNKYFTERVENIFKARTKSEKSAQEQFSKVSPIIETLAERYGVDAGDYDSLVKKIADDTAALESEAYDKGMTVEQLKETKRLQRDNKIKDAKLQEIEKEKATQTRLIEWDKQEKEMKVKYPDFSLRSELVNPKFVDLIGKGLDLRTAYIATHHDDLVANVLKDTANKTTKTIADSIQSASSRAVESALSDVPSVVYKSDPSKLTDADMKDIMARVARGEMISF